MPQTSSRIFDNVGRMMNDAAGVADGVRREVESMVRAQAERFLIERTPETIGAIDRSAQEQMETRHRVWINDLPPTLALLDDVFLCHGTPTSDEETWLDNFWDGRASISPDEATVAAKAEGF